MIHFILSEKYMYTSSDSFLFEYFQYSFLRDQGYGKYDTIQRADLRISDIGNLVGSDWVNLAHELDISDSDINIVKSEYPDSDGKLNQTQNYEFCMKYNFVILKNTRQSITPNILLFQASKLL